MTDHALFVVAPYLAAAIFVLVGAVRYVLGHLQGDRADTAIRRVHGSRLAVAATRSAIAVIAIGHLLAFAVPRGLLLWDQQLLRLVLLEAVGIVAGSVALAGLAAAHVRQARASGPRAAWPPMDVVAGTLVLMATLSGLFIAVRYRWASSWSEVTVAPYLQSLVRLAPSTTLVEQLPFLVKLHVFGAFVLLAVAPMSGIVRVVTVPVDRLVQRAVAPAANLLRPAWGAIAGWGSTRVKDAYAGLARHETEEN
jgi:nitrate reductase gamma subunit